MMAGAEIFVPKICSMKIVDMVKFLDPSAKIDVIGIRPGEKLHETMISVDDARDTIELTDRYIILPPRLNPYGDRNNYGGGRPVAEGFVYASDINDEWIGKRGFSKILGLVDRQ